MQYRVPEGGYYRLPNGEVRFLRYDQQYPVELLKVHLERTNEMSLIEKAKETFEDQRTQARDLKYHLKESYLAADQLFREGTAKVLGPLATKSINLIYGLFKRKENQGEAEPIYPVVTENSSGDSV